MTSSPTKLRRQAARLLDPSPLKPQQSLWQRLLTQLAARPAEFVVAVPAAEVAGAPEPKPAPNKRTAGDGPCPVAPEPEQQPQQPEQPRHPVRMTPSQERRMRQISRQNRFEQLAVAASMHV